MSEVWLDILGYEGVYQVSSDGRIRNSSGAILRPHLDHKGYLRIWLRLPGEKKKFLVHRIVASVFIRPPEDGEQVNHKNYAKTDNRVSNLEWCTGEQNMRHAFERRGYHAFSSSRKLSFKAAQHLRDMASRGTPMGDLVCASGLNRNTIKEILAGRTYKSPMPWEDAA